MFNLRISKYSVTYRYVVIQALEDCADLFKVGTRYEAAYIDKQLVLQPDPNGSLRWTTRSANDRHDVVAQLRVLDMDDAPPFHVDAAEFTFDGDFLIWTRPRIYELPWTRRPPADARTALAELGLRERLASACRWNADLVAVCQATPLWAREVLRGERWRNIVSEFQSNA